MVLAGVLLCLFCLVDLENRLNSLDVILVLSSIGSCLFYYLHTIRVISFDEVSMYIKSRSSTKEVPLIDIQEIQQCIGYYDKNRYWRVRFKEKDSKDNSILFLPKRFGHSFDDFMMTVKEMNPNVKLQNWSL